MNTTYLIFLLFVIALETAFGCDQYAGSAYGSQKFPGRSCADILAKRCADTNKNGIYWIALGSSTPFPVFCDMEAGGWTMVYKLVSGVDGRPAAIWNTPFTVHEYSVAVLNLGNRSQRHYKNRIVQNWGKFKPSEARVVLHKRGQEKAALRFNAANSDKNNWFSQANILESSWQDMTTESKNYFVINGPCFSSAGCRDFHINHVYNSCPGDEGWLSIGNSNVCSWEKRFASGVKLIYRIAGTKHNYNQFSKFDSADVFAVFLR